MASAMPGLHGEPRPLAEQRDGEQDREHRLQLEDERGEAGGHAGVHRDEEQRELQAAQNVPTARTHFQWTFGGRDEEHAAARRA